MARKIRRLQVKWSGDGDIPVPEDCIHIIQIDELPELGRVYVWYIAEVN